MNYNTRKEMMSNEDNYCIVSVNNKDDIIFIGTESECESKFASIIHNEDNNDKAECYTIADYEHYLNM